MAKFDLRTFLSENKLTSNSKLLREEEGFELNKTWSGKSLPAVAPGAGEKLAQVFKADTIDGFTKQLQQVIKDPKVLAALRAGDGDGEESDDKLQIDAKQLPVKKLKPTQNVIGFQNSIEPLFTAKYPSSLGTILNPDGGVADVGNPVVTLNGEWIIDGHHRWSQVLAGNPDAQVNALDMNAPNMSPKQALKIAHAAVTAHTGTVPSSKADNAANVLDQNVTPEYIAKYVKQLGGINPKAKELFAKMGYTSDEAIYKYVADNLDMVKDLGQEGRSSGPDRVDMPQTDSQGKSKDRLDSLEKGTVNISPPFGGGN